MTRVPIFRWVFAVGVLLVCASGCVCLREPANPPVRQVSLSVLTEQPDGPCTVRWRDPFDGATRQGGYVCDRERPRRDKGPRSAGVPPGVPAGEDLGYVLAGGPHRGELYRLWDDSDGSPGSSSTTRVLLACGLAALAVGALGGGARLLAVPAARGNLGGVRTVALRRTAARLVDDHRRAVRTLRAACVPVSMVAVAGRNRGLPVQQDVLRLAMDTPAHTRGVTSNASAELLHALWVLVETGPAVRGAAGEAEDLVGSLDTLVTGAAPLFDRRARARLGAGERQRAMTALSELRTLLAGVEERGLRERFAKASADLQRARETAPSPHAVQADFRARPEAYRSAFTAHAPRLPPADD